LLNEALLCLHLVIIMYNENGRKRDINMVLQTEKKYLCLLCGMIIDNPDYCEYCGATSENIVPYEEE